MNAQNILRIMFGIVAVAFIAFLVRSVPTFIPKAAPFTVEEEETDTWLVSRVIDGDTIQLSNGEKVRYIGIDAPETKDPRKPVECFGEEAYQKNRELVLGKRVRLEKDVSERDKFGRLLRYVWVGDKMVNLELIKEGYARVYTVPPDVKYQKLFQEAEQEARQFYRGLWGKCNF